MPCKAKSMSQMKMCRRMPTYHKPTCIYSIKRNSKTTTKKLLKRISLILISANGYSSSRRSFTPLCIHYINIHYLLSQKASNLFCFPSTNKCYRHVSCINRVNHSLLFCQDAAQVVNTKNNLFKWRK